MTLLNCRDTKGGWSKCVVTNRTLQGPLEVIWRTTRK